MQLSKKINQFIWKKTRTTLVAISLLTNSQIMDACKSPDNPTPNNITVYDISTCKQVTIPQSIYDQNPTKYTKIDCNLPNKSNWHIFDPNIDKLPLWIFEWNSYNEIPDKQWYKKTNSKDSAAIANLFTNGNLPSGQNISPNIQNNGIQFSNISLKWTDNTITDQEFSDNYKIWVEINQQDLRKIFTNIVYPRLLKQLKIEFIKNWFYPKWGIISINIPHKFLDELP